MQKNKIQSNNRKHGPNEHCFIEHINSVIRDPESELNCNKQFKPKKLKDLITH